MNNIEKGTRVIVYIDGYNLYYGLREAFHGKYKWLDLQALADSFLQEGMTLVAVKYFTAVTKSNAKTRTKQEVFLKALTSYCDKLEIIYGRFLAKPRQCRKCGGKYEYYEEKKTDVNIACQVLNDAHLNNYDCCYIVSGDSDLVPPVKIIKQSFPDKKVIIASPPKRKSNELCRIAHGFFSISKLKIQTNQLPQIVTSTRGARLEKPKKWI